MRPEASGSGWVLEILGLGSEFLWCFRYQGPGMVWGTQKTSPNPEQSWGYNEKCRQQEPYEAPLTVITNNCLKKQ